MQIREIAMSASQPKILTVPRFPKCRHLRRLFSLAFLLAAISAISAPPASAQELNKGWWVVVGAFPTDPPQRQRADVMRMNAAARRCGVRLFNDFSGKFRGFNPGVNVFVIGAYASRSRAQAMQAVAQPCFPGAYVKYGEHLGE
jgi:hypothetical protein